MKSIFITIFIFAVSFQLFAKSSSGFETRFHLERENGKVVTIRDFSLDGKFRLSPYIEFIKQLIIEEQMRLGERSGNYAEDIAELLDADMIGMGSRSYSSSNNNLGNIINSLKELARLDVPEVFENSKFKDVLVKFEVKLTEALQLLDPTVVAKLDDSRYFYKKNVIHQVAQWALKYAKKKLSYIPLLNSASFVILQVEKMIIDRRLFHQNMLLHYFENFDPAELNMTKEEVDSAFSSIYESKIPWFNKWESDRAVSTWNRYGTDKFYKGIRAVNSQLRLNRHRYSRLGERVNFAFIKGEVNGERVILNIFHKENMFNKNFAIAHFEDRPNRVARKRAVLQLAELGLSLISIPNWIKSSTESYIKSFYYQQQLLEGALYGYFDSEGDTVMRNRIRKNQMNPFQHLAI